MTDDDLKPAPGVSDAPIDNAQAPEPGTKLKPFSEQYPVWNKPTFKATDAYIQPKGFNETSNRSFGSRLMEGVLDDFSEARNKLNDAALQQLQPPDART